MTFDLDLWPTDLTITRDHLLVKDYLPTKFEASGAKRSWVISCTRLRDTDIPTDQPTHRPTDMCKAICPSFFKGGHKHVQSNMPLLFSTGGIINTGKRIQRTGGLDDVWVPQQGRRWPQGTGTRHRQSDRPPRPGSLLWQPDVHRLILQSGWRTLTAKEKKTVIHVHQERQNIIPYMFASLPCMSTIIQIAIK